MFLAAAIFPTIKLNTTTLKSGEPLQISCSFGNLLFLVLHEIQVNGTTVASSKNSFVHTIQSVRSTDAGSYTCKASLMVFPYTASVSTIEILSGKSTF